jgi:Dolichyl-phosphate-mannose-protein mannosyltransferase
VDGLWMALYLIVICALGAVGVLLAPARDKRLLVESVGIAAIFGTGSLGYGLFLLALAGVRPGRVPLAALGVGALAVVVFHLLRQKAAFPKVAPFLHDRGRLRIIATLILCFLLIMFLCTVTAHALAFPLYEWDAFAVWGYKAKVIAAEGLSPRPDYFTDVTMSYSHLDYPLMTPLLMAGVFGVLQHVDDHWAKLFSVVLYLGLICLVLAFARCRLSPLKALAVTAVTVGVPVMLRWAGSGNADVPLAAFNVAALFFLIRWLEESNLRDCTLCAVMSAFAAFTKNEGLAFGILTCVVMFLPVLRSQHTGRRLAGASLYLVVFLLLSLPWLIWSADIPRTHENYAAHFGVSEILAKVDRLPVIVNEMVRQIVNVRRYGLLWIVLIASAVMGRHAFRNRTIRIVWLLFILQLGVYSLIFLVTPWDVRLQMSVSLDRLLLHVIPAAGCLIAMHLRSCCSDVSKASSWPSIPGIQSPGPPVVRQNSNGRDLSCR